MVHYAALIVAENPVELHKEYLELDEPDELDELETGRLQSKALASDTDEQLARKAAEMEAELQHINVIRHDIPSIADSVFDQQL